jgi:hypothetical protein
MKTPTRQFVFKALFHGVFMFLFDYFLIGIVSKGGSEIHWLGNLALWLGAGVILAWADEGADTYIERKNARWKARKEAEKE